MRKSLPIKRQLWAKGAYIAGAGSSHGLARSAIGLREVLFQSITQVAPGFEIRSLQEFMAARALTTGPSDKIIERLRQLAYSAHWRNIWLLAAGRTFAQQHLRDQVVLLLDGVDTWTGRACRCCSLAWSRLPPCGSSAGPGPSYPASSG